MSSRAYTQEEGREKLLNHVRSLVDYWDGIKKDTTKEQLEGLAFSILVMLDGGSCALPGMKVIPDPHSSDKAYHIQQGENYWPKNMDLGGGLHEEFFHPSPK